MESLKLNNPPNHEIPLISHDIQQGTIQTYNATYHKLGIIKAGIIINLYTAVRYGTQYLWGILF